MGKKLSQLKTKRLMILPMSDKELENLIQETKSSELKQAYQEMLVGCKIDPEHREWYTAWKICLKQNKKEIGKEIGSMGFKGPVKNYCVEIGYGINAEYEGNGYASEVAKALIDWAFTQENVYFVEAEVAPDNIASRKVLEKLSFQPDGIGEEGDRFVLEKAETLWMPIYMCFGLSIGLSFGNSAGNMSMGMCLGMGIGLCIGAALDASFKKQREQIRKEREAEKKQENTDEVLESSERDCDI